MQQSNLFSSSAESSPAVMRNDETARSGPPTPSMNDAPIVQRPAQRAGRRRRWEFLLAITVRIFVGVIVMVLPWSMLWDNNHLLQAIPRLATLLSFGATRGIVSGLGLMNLWIAVDDTLHRGERYN